MIATIIDCEEIRTKTRYEPALRFKVEIENEIHYIFLSLNAIHLVVDIWKHLHLPVFTKVNGFMLIQNTFVRNKILPVDEDSYRDKKYFRIAFNRLNK